eukprot:11169262-Alexandrium_andersonii.AAC.1
MITIARLLSQKALEEGTPLCLFKADVRKAFDSVSHASVATSLLRRGIPGIIVSALLREMRDTRLSFAAPGLPARAQGIQMKKGVRQGACSSPAIWVL